MHIYVIIIKRKERRWGSKTGAWGTFLFVYYIYLFICFLLHPTGSYVGRGFIVLTIFLPLKYPTNVTGKLHKVEKMKIIAFKTTSAHSK